MAAEISGSSVLSFRVHYCSGTQTFRAVRQESICDENMTNSGKALRHVVVVVLAKEKRQTPCLFEPGGAAAGRGVRQREVPSRFVFREKGDALKKTLARRASRPLAQLLRGALRWKGVAVAVQQLLRMERTPGQKKASVDTPSQRCNQQPCFYDRLLEKVTETRTRVCGTTSPARLQSVAPLEPAALQTSYVFPLLFVMCNHSNKLLLEAHLLPQYPIRKFRQKSRKKVYQEYKVKATVHDNIINTPS